MPLIAVIVIAIALTLIPIGLAHAQTVNQISGKYTDSASGIEIDLPLGWTGIDYFGSPLVSPDGVQDMSAWPKVSMMIIVAERSNLEETIAASQDSYEDACSTISTTYVRMDGMDAMELVKECNSDGHIKSKIYMVPTNTKVAILAFTASSEEQYDRYLAAFDQSTKTLQMGDSTVDVRSFVSSSLGLETSLYPVNVAGKPLDLPVDSSSQIEEFRFEEASKQISFRVKGEESTKGITIIPISWVLEGPYTVAINGEATDYDIIRDEITGETRIRLDYNHSVHDVAISGAAVVPEFPMPIVGAIAAVMGAVVIMSRINSRRQP